MGCAHTTHSCEDEWTISTGDGANGDTMARVCPITGVSPACTPGRCDAVYLRDPGSGIIFLAERPRLEDMAAFVDAEYESGVYRDYVDAREPSSRPSGAGCR